MTQTQRIAGLVRKLGTFLAANTLIQAINMATGLIILWVLPVQQYALYISCAAIIAVATIASDSGISQAIVTLGGQAFQDRVRMSGIFATAWHMRGRLTWLVTPLALAATLVLGYQQHWTPQQMLVLGALIVITNLAQIRISCYTGLFNVYQDTRAILVSNGIPALLRIALTLALLQQWPVAALALAVNALAFVIQDRVSRSSGSRHVVDDTPLVAAVQREIRRFVVPLVPGVIYFIFQGQLAIFLLTWLGETEAIAEVGALGRLLQVFMLLAAVNGYFVQPHFSRIRSGALFWQRFAWVCGVGSVLAVVVLGTAQPLAQWWVLILGSKYAHLQALIPLTLAGSLAVLFGSTLYSIVIATQFTRYQWWQIPLGLAAQGAVILLYGVHSTRDALLLTFAPAASYLVLQLLLAGVAARHLPARRP